MTKSHVSLHTVAYKDAGIDIPQTKSMHEKSSESWLVEMQRQSVHIAAALDVAQQFTLGNRFDRLAIFDQLLELYHRWSCSSTPGFIIQRILVIVDGNAAF